MRILMAVAVLLTVFTSSTTAYAQSGIDGRVDRLEREMRAVQRKVFPGGAGQTFEPQITAEQNTIVPGAPSNSPVADLTQRVAALESQVATLTGHVEETQYRVRTMEDAFNAYKRSTDARIKALEDTASATAERPVISGTASVPDAPVRPPVRSAEKPADKPADKPVKPADKPVDKPAEKPTGTRAEAIAAIERPSSDDPADDQYVYGYRLWAAKFYPEARKELEGVVAKYPKHRRASWAQNLLGRAYLDAGAPSLAAVAFYENYKKNPGGERAPDSLYYLAQALTELKKPSSEVCKVYGELLANYTDKISESMKSSVDEQRAARKCK